MSFWDNVKKFTQPYSEDEFEEEYADDLYEDEALKDFAILYVTTPEGETGLYTYDSAEKTFQRYVPVEAPEETPVDVPVVEEKDEEENSYCCANACNNWSGNTSSTHFSVW